jgi:uncharacterized protein (TIGR02246 family)
MHIRWLQPKAFVAAVLFCVAAGAALASGPDALGTTVQKANAEWAEAMKTGDAAVIAAPYADDAVFVLSDGQTLRGRAAIEALYRDGFAKGGLASDTKIDSKSLVRDGNFAYESGSADVTVMREGKPVTRGGRYLTVWQMQSDGAWKILRNIVLP